MEGDAEEVSNGNSAETSSVLTPEMREALDLIAVGQHDMARLRLQRHLQRDPENAQAQFLFGLTFHRERRYGRAQPLFERALELDPSYAPLHYFYGWCMYYLGEPEVARHAFEKHLSLAGDEPDAHFGIGLIDLDEGDPAAAEARFRTAIELETMRGQDAKPPDLSKFHARLGEALDRQGNPEDARRHLETSTSLYPDHYEAHFLLYRVLMRLGDEEAASAALRAHDEAKQRVRPEPPPLQSQ